MTETAGALAAALAKAQGEISNATFNKTNPHFKSKYADLASIRDAVTPALSKHGLSVTQLTDFTGERFVLRTRLMHSAGEYVESSYPLPLAADKPQVMGSAISYARRYSLAAIIGIASEEDDDAEGAEGRTSGNGHAEPRRTATATKGATPKPDASTTTPEGDTLISQIVGSETAQDLKLWGDDPNVKFAIGKLPPPEQDRVRRAYAERSKGFKVAA